MTSYGIQGVLFMRPVSVRVELYMRYSVYGIVDGAP